MASKQLWTSPLLSDHCLTLAQLMSPEELRALPSRAVLLGSPDFRGFEWIPQARAMLAQPGTAQRSFVMPAMACNYLQDQGRYELHMLAAVVRPTGPVVLVDPNGVPPADFGEPNALLLQLPWKRA